MKKNPMKIDSAILNRTFTYTQGDCRLSFVLRVDIKQELKDYVDLLKMGLKEVEEELNKKNV